MADILSESFDGVDWQWIGAPTFDLTPPYTHALQCDTNNGSTLCAINSSANNPSGPGAKGLIQTVGDGSNQNGPSTRWELTGSPAEIWMRFYMKFPAAMGFDGGYAKIVDFQDVRLIWGCETSLADGSFGFWQDSSPDYFFQNSGTLNGSLIKWSDVMGGSNGDNQFHCYEFHLKQAGSSSIAEIWIDNVAAGSNTTCTINGSGGFGTLRFWTNQSSVSGGAGPYEIIIDDIVVSTSARVGPLAGGGGGGTVRGSSLGGMG